jgi:uncharacterized protein YukE
MPDVMGARIAVPPELEASGSQIMSIGAAIDQELISLRNLLAPLAQYWTGQAAIGHEDVQAQWNTASQNLMTDVGTLGDIGRAQQRNWSNYVHCEAANNNSWAH